MPLTQAQVNSANDILTDIRGEVDVFSRTMGDVDWLLSNHDRQDGQGGHILTDQQCTDLLTAYSNALKSAAQAIVTRLP